MHSLVYGMQFPPKYRLHKGTSKKIDELLYSLSAYSFPRFSYENSVINDIAGKAPEPIEKLFIPSYGKKIFYPQKTDTEKFFSILNFYRFAQFCRKVKVQPTYKLTAKALKKIHAMLLKDILPEHQCGKWRQEENTVGADEARRYLPAYKSVPQATRNAIDWYNRGLSDKKNRLINTLLLIPVLEHIHPFSNGNGRTSRATVTYLLYKQGFTFIDPLALETEFRSFFPDELTSMYKYLCIEPPDLTQIFNTIVNIFYKTVKNTQKTYNE